MVQWRLVEVMPCLLESGFQIVTTRPFSILCPAYLHAQQDCRSGSSISLLSQQAGRERAQLSAAPPTERPVPPPRPTSSRPHAHPSFPLPNLESLYPTRFKCRLNGPNIHHSFVFPAGRRMLHGDCRMMGHTCARLLFMASSA